MNKKPNGIQISDLKWKRLLYNVYAGRNILLTGHSGSGKTTIMKSLKNVFPDRFVSEMIDMGTVVNPEHSFAGTRQLIDGETKFIQSYFAECIQKKNAIILIDELTRAPKPAWSYLMGILDPNNRKIIIPHLLGVQIIHVADGVSFISTTNEGAEYTATNKLDHAVKGRFSIINMDYLDYDSELKLQLYKHPELDHSLIENVCKIACDTRNNKSQFKITTKMTALWLDLIVGQNGIKFSVKDAFDSEILELIDDDKIKQNLFFIFKKYF